MGLGSGAQLDMFNTPPPQEYRPSVEERARVAKENRIFDSDPNLVYENGEWYYNDSTWGKKKIAEWKKIIDELDEKSDKWWQN